ncbi:MAG: hypothetical protein Q9198_002565 [Flavoplaca austrocitrina]
MTKSSVQRIAGKALLTNILPTSTLPTDLALLVALCTDQMRRSLLVNFLPPTDSYGFLPEQDLITFNDPRSVSATHIEEAEIRRQEDLASPQMQESAIAQGLLATASNMSSAETTKEAAAENVNGRRWKVGFAAVAEAALMGMTGGLAAPLVAAGVGTIVGGLGIGIPLIGGYLGVSAGSSVLIGSLFGAYGGKMTGRIMHQYAREVKDSSFIPLHSSASKGASPISTPKADDRSIAEAILVPSMSEGEQSWHKLCVAIGITGWLMDESEITSPWRTQKFQGERPVVLVGYSLGARVIYQSMLALSEQNAFGLVESVIVIGASLSSDECYWRRIHAMVAGRVVNVFSSDDHILGFLYRSSSFQFGVSGLQAVQGVARIENVDITNLVDKRGHAVFKSIIGSTLQEIGFPDVYLIKVDKEVKALREAEEMEKLKEEEMKAHGDQEVAQLNAIIDEEDALVQNKTRKHTAPKDQEADLLMTPEASDGESERTGGIAMLDLEDDLPRTSEKHRQSIQTASHRNVGHVTQSLTANEELKSETAQHLS